MSLINDVLRDLERRQAGSREAPPPPAARRSRRKLHWSLWLLSAVVLGGVLHWSLERPSDEVGRQTTLVASVEPAAPAPEPAEDPPTTIEHDVAPTKAGAQFEREPGPSAPNTASPHAVAREASDTGEPAQNAAASVEAATEPAVSAQAAPDKLPQEASAESAEPAIRIERAGESDRPGQSRLDDARRAIARGHFGLAEDHARRLVDQYPERADGHEILARALLDQGRTDQAVQALHAAMESAEEPSGPAALLGRILLERGELGRAREVLESRPPEIATDPDYHLLLAAARHQSGDHEAAAATYRALADLVPSTARAWIGLGSSLESLKRREEAVAAYRQALTSRDPRAVQYARERLRHLEPSQPQAGP